MFGTKDCLVFIAALLFVWNAQHLQADGQNPSPTPTPARPPAPVLVSPANGASLVQPIKLGWNHRLPRWARSAATPGRSRLLQLLPSWLPPVLRTRKLILQFRYVLSDKVSGLANGTYFWRVKASESTNNGGVDSAWSTPRSFIVTGLGPAPATPTITTPGEQRAVSRD